MHVDPIDSSAPIPTSSPPLAQPSLPAAVAPRAKRVRNLAVPFGVALVSGIFLIVTIPSPFPPLLAMVGYLFFGLDSSRREGVLIEFTDSFYYLGFSLTLVALTHGLGAFVGVPKVDQAVLVTFGQALLTTVLGVIGRISVQLFYRTAQEGIERTNQEVERISRELIDELQRATDRIANGVAATATSIEKELPASIQALVENVKAAVRNVHDVAAEAERLAQPVGALVATADNAREAFATLHGTVTTTDQQVRNDAVTFGKLLERTHADLARSASGAVDPLVHALAAARAEVDKVSGVGPVLTGFRESVQAARTEVSDLTSVIEKVGRAVNDTVEQSELPRAVKALTNNVKKAVDNVHQVASAAGELVQPVKTLADQVATADGAFVSLRTKAEAASQGIANHSAEFASSLANTQAEADARASAAVAELVQALSTVRIELSQIQAVRPTLQAFGTSVQSAGDEVDKLKRLVDEVAEVVTERIRGVSP
jgi:ABC-type transporter Mla subunit MlaD